MLLSSWSSWLCWLVSALCLRGSPGRSSSASSSLPLRHGWGGRSSEASAARRDRPVSGCTSGRACPLRGPAAGLLELELGGLAGRAGWLLHSFDACSIVQSVSASPPMPRRHSGVKATTTATTSAIRAANTPSSVSNQISHHATCLASFPPENVGPWWQDPASTVSQLYDSWVAIRSWCYHYAPDGVHTTQQRSSTCRSRSQRTATSKAPTS